MGELVLNLMRSNQLFYNNNYKQRYDTCQVFFKNQSYNYWANKPHKSPQKTLYGKYVMLHKQRSHCAKSYMTDYISAVEIRINLGT